MAKKKPVKKASKPTKASKPKAERAKAETTPNPNQSPPKRKPTEAEATRWATALVRKAGNKEVPDLFDLCDYVLVDYGESEKDALRKMKAILIEHLTELFQKQGWFCNHSLEEYLKAPGHSCWFFGDNVWR
jgi:hypothetical protein